VAGGGPPGPGETFATSLHESNYPGQETFYSAENGGFELVTGVPYDDLGCKNCHDRSRWEDADPPQEWPGTESCANCHEDLSNPSSGITDELCLGCHSRQSAEADIFTDVHRDLGTECIGCHNLSVTFHGDGTEYTSFLEPGYPRAECEDCHVEGGAAPVPPADVTEHATHLEQIDCSACHMQSVIACYNCHFDSQLADASVERPFAEISDFVMLLNREGKDKVYGATFQSLVNEQQTFVVVVPYYAHTISVQGRICADCHANFGGSIPAITEYNASGTMTITTWDETAEGAARITHLTGIIPVPGDWATAFQFAWLDYTGDPTTPGEESDPALWELLEQGPAETTQMLFATPLTDAQMAAIGATGP
jgi:hypothetical protein